MYWTTDDEEVATVAGTATITATTLTLDGTGLVYVVDEVTVTVTGPPGNGT